MAESELLNETKESLERVARFDVHSLPRKEDLGTALNFEGAVEPARRVIDLFRKLPSEALSEFPEATLKPIKEQADQFYQLLSTVLSFSASTANPGSERDALIQQIQDQYPSVFKALSPHISYAVARTVDFNRLEEQGRAAIQSINDRTTSLLQGIEDAQQQAQKTLDDVRAAAAEQGVTQQARYFKLEADSHDTQAKEWLKWTLISAGGLVIYAIVSMFIHLIPGLTPETTYAAIQLAASKILVFIVIAYVVLTCGRNFMSHKHNSVVNRHRQNALQTFTTIVDATSTPAAQDIVLSHAAASIFEPQETGYARQHQSQDGALSAASVLRSLSGTQTST